MKDSSSDNAELRERCRLERPTRRRTAGTSRTVHRVRRAIRRLSSITEPNIFSTCPFPKFEEAEEDIGGGEEGFSRLKVGMLSVSEPESVRWRTGLVAGNGTGEGGGVNIS